MDDLMRICGSCHTLVQAEEDDTFCPRCSEALEPSHEDVLGKFIETGIVVHNRKGGTTLKEAQAAASAVLGMLMHARAKLKLHHLGTQCSDCVDNQPGGE